MSTQYRWKKICSSQIEYPQKCIPQQFSQELILEFWSHLVSVPYCGEYERHPRNFAGVKSFTPYHLQDLFTASVSSNVIRETIWCQIVRDYLLHTAHECLFFLSPIFTVWGWISCFYCTVITWVWSHMQVELEIWVNVLWFQSIPGNVWKSYMISYLMNHHPKSCSLLYIKMNRW